MMPLQIIYFMYMQLQQFYSNFSIISLQTFFNLPLQLSENTQDKTPEIFVAYIAFK